MSLTWDVFSPTAGAVVFHPVVSAKTFGSDEFRSAVAADLEGFPDQTIVLEQILVDGGNVASRWTYRGTHTGDYYGIPPTGRGVVSTVLAFDRVVGGKVVENWTVFDNYDVMRQLGILPDTEGAVR